MKIEASLVFKVGYIEVHVSTNEECSVYPIENTEARTIAKEMTNLEGGIQGYKMMLPTPWGDHFPIVMEREEAERIGKAILAKIPEKPEDWIGHPIQIDKNTTRH